MFKIRHFVFGLMVVSLASCSMLGLGSDTDFIGMGTNTNSTAFKVGSGIDAATDLYKAAALSDEDVKTMSLQAAQQLDSEERIAPANSDYVTRLNRITGKHLSEEGLNLNFKVYLSDEVNAFALADGSIRVYSGLMDLMNDDEVLAVIGHEIGHVYYGHSKSAMRWAYGLSAARKGVASTGGVAGAVAASDIGFILEKLLDAQYSQDQEKEADDFGLQFLARNQYNLAGIVGAMRKLAMLGSEASMFSSHPDAESRAARLEAQIESGDIVVARGRSDEEVNVQPEMVNNEPEMPQAQEVPPRQPEQQAQVVRQEPVMPPAVSQTKNTGSAEAAVAPGFYIQVAADQTPEEATARATKLQELNARAVIQEVMVSGQTFFRVLVGPYLEEPTTQLEMLRNQAYGIAKGTPFIKKFPK